MCKLGDICGKGVTPAEEGGAPNSIDGDHDDGDGDAIAGIIEWCTAKVLYVSVWLSVGPAHML